MNSRKDLGVKLAALQRQVGAEGHRKYWQCLEELAETEAFGELVRQEFPAMADVWPDKLSRRRFLSLMGASLALSGIGGCSVRPAPEGTIVPYVHPPEELHPGVTLFYATTMLHGGEGVGLLVESHEGRPTKIEGNPQHPGSLGATNAFNQASILTLYDPMRSQTVIQGDNIRGWGDAEAAIRSAMAAQQDKRGAGLRILTGAVNSPTLGWQIDKLLAAFPEAKWHQYEPVDRSNVYLASQDAFGTPAEPIFDFTAADVVLSLDSDFLYSEPGHLRYTNDFMSRRRVRTTTETAATATMNRLYVIETGVSSTGAKADHRLAVRMRDIEKMCRAIASALGITGVSDVWNEHAKWVTAVTRDLQGCAGRCLVLAGHRQPPAVHVLVQAMNERLGNVGSTLRYIKPIAHRPVDQMADLRELTEDMARGSVEALFILGGNPAYTAPADFDFAAKLDKAPQSFYLGLYENETSRHCAWHLPKAHYLEAWSDARAFDGTASIVQPLIAPLYQGRSAHELIGVIAGDRDIDGREIVRSHWRAEHERQPGGNQAFEEFWEVALHDGVIANSANEARDLQLKSDWQQQIASTKTADAESTTDPDVEIVFQADPTIYDGRYANNAWLQELPKPLTKLTWDNAAIMSPRMAKVLGVRYVSFAHGGEHGGYDVSMLNLRIGGRDLQAAAWIMPGHADECVTIHLGYGQQFAARASGAWQPISGFNAYELRTSEHPWFWSGLSIEIASGATYPLACTQAHYTMAERDPIRTGTLDQYHRAPSQIAEAKEHSTGAIDASLRPPRGTLYEPFDYSPPQHKWGMSIDTTACIGCNACVVACQAENNIPVVGKDQVLFGREMHWIRIDRYVTGDSESPEEFHFQPVACVHCEHAPCEYVCPVAATVHSAEGLNEMVYNRCVGTRFCSNNCPYKVRRFNFLEYADFKSPQRRLQYNPDVTVRSRGVMEKCSYCVQRIRQGEVNAQTAGKSMKDGEILTACQAVCPAKAIAFGDLNDTASEVASWKASPLDYGLLSELNTMPRTTYLAALRNPNQELGSA